MRDKSALDSGTYRVEKTFYNQERSVSCTEQNLDGRKNRVPLTLEQEERGGGVGGAGVSQLWEQLCWGRRCRGGNENARGRGFCIAWGQLHRVGDLKIRGGELVHQVTGSIPEGPGYQVQPA